MSGLDGLGWPNPEDEPKPTKSMSDTPETDGEWNRIACYDHPQFEQGIAEFARKLERERDEARGQRDRLIKSVEPLKYWLDISECDCSNPLPQGGCLRCDLNRILKTTNPNEL